jgi:hypothetical protein
MISERKMNVFGEYEVDDRIEVAPCKTIPVTDEMRREDERLRREREASIKITWKLPVETKFAGVMYVSQHKHKPQQRVKRCGGCGKRVTACKCDTEARYCYECKAQVGYKNTSGLCRSCIAGVTSKATSEARSETMKAKNA